MTGDDDRDGIAPHCATDGACGSGRSDLGREPTVGDQRARRHRQQHPQHALGERGQVAKIERDAEGQAAAVGEGVQFFQGLRDQRMARTLGAETGCLPWSQ